jgi:hypothetical protein
VLFLEHPSEIVLTVLECYRVEMPDASPVKETPLAGVSIR